MAGKLERFFLRLIRFDQDYLKRTPDGSRRAESLALRAVGARIGFNYGGFAVDNGYGAGGAKINTISAAGANI